MKAFNPDCGPASYPNMPMSPLSKILNRYQACFPHLITELTGKFLEMSNEIKMIKILVTDKKLNKQMKESHEIFVESLERVSNNEEKLDLLVDTLPLLATCYILFDS